MFTLSCTYLDVLPAFVELLANFGKRIHAQSFGESSFRQLNQLGHGQYKRLAPGPRIPALGWSGRALRLCYVLRSVERSPEGDWPWSIRDCAVHHSFDVERTRLTWILVKGNSLLQERISSSTADPAMPEASRFQTLAEAFASSLVTHLLVCEWALENWDAYLAFLETRSSEITEDAKSNKIDLEPLVVKDSPVTFLPSRRETNGSGHSVASSFARVRRKVSNHQPERRPSAFKTAHSDSEKAYRPPELQASVKIVHDTRGQKEFTFGDLQELQHYCDKIEEAVLALRLTIDVFTSLSSYYENLVQQDAAFSAVLSEGCKSEMNHFHSALQSCNDRLTGCIRRFEALKEKVRGSIQLVREICTPLISIKTNRE